MALPAVSSVVAGTTGNFARFCLPDADEAAKTSKLGHLPAACYACHIRR